MTGLTWVIIPLTFSILMNTTLTVSYNIDDLVLAMFAQGVGIANEPTPFLYYSHFGLGWMLANLYSVFPGAPWYWFWLTLIHLLSDIVVFNALLKKNRSIFVFACLCFYLMLVSAPAYFEVSYTAVSFLVSMSAVVLLLARIIERNVSKRALATVGSLLLCGCMTRFQAGMAIPIMSSPLILLTIIKKEHVCGFKVRGMKSILSAGTIGIFAIMSLFLTNKFAYSSAEWREFISFNEYKQEILDYDRVISGDRLKDTLTSIKWNENTISMMRNWIFFDGELFNAQSLGRIVAAPGLVSHAKLLRLLEPFKQLKIKIILSLAGICLMLIWLAKERLPAVVFATSVLGVISVLLLYYQRVTNFVLPPLCASAVLVPAVFLRDTLNKSVGILALVAFSAIIPMWWSSFSEANVFSKKAQEQTTELLSILKNDQNYVFVSQQPLFRIDPLSNLKQLSGQNIFLLGTPSRSPTVRIKLQRRGFNNYYDLMLSADTNLIFLNSDRGRFGLLVNFAQERTGKKISVRNVHSGTSFSIVKLSTI